MRVIRSTPYDAMIKSLSFWRNSISNLPHLKQHSSSRQKQRNMWRWKLWLRKRDRKRKRNRSRRWGLGFRLMDWVRFEKCRKKSSRINHRIFTSVLSSHKERSHYSSSTWRPRPAKTLSPPKLSLKTSMLRSKTSLDWARSSRYCRRQ